MTAVDWIIIVGFIVLVIIAVWPTGPRGGFIDE